MMKKPIIATAVGGNLEIIHDHDTGLLVSPQDVESLYTAMKLLYEDATLRDQLASNARSQYEQRFVFDTIVKERFMTLYEKNTN
jgi:glycosyltransferase involved in cell wall biosynthesis